MPAPSEDPLDDPARRDRASYPFWLREQVRWSDTDRAGHANNRTFLSFLEAARALMLREFLDPGSPRFALMVVAEFRVRLLGEMQWPADIDIGSGVSVIGTSSCVFAQALFDQGRCVAVADARLVLIDDHTRRSRPLTPALRACVEGWRLEPLNPPGASR